MIQTVSRTKRKKGKNWKLSNYYKLSRTLIPALDKIIKIKTVDPSYL